MYMQLFGVLADVGLYMTFVREISKRPARTDELVGNVLTLRLLLSIVVIALAAGTASCSRTRRICVWESCSPGTLAIRHGDHTFVGVLQSRLRMGRAVVGEVLGRAARLVSRCSWLDSTWVSTP